MDDESILGPINGPHALQGPRPIKGPIPRSMLKIQMGFSQDGQSINVDFKIGLIV